MRRFHNFAYTFLLTCSFLGLLLITAFASSTPTRQEDLPWRKPFVGAVFSFVCVLGILAGTFPSKCSIIRHSRKAEQEEFLRESATSPSARSCSALTFRGHHPNCGNFGAHVFRIHNRAFCAGCTGLVLGAVLSLFGALLYFFVNTPFMLDGVLVFWIGFVGVSCGLLQYHLFNLGRSSIHLLVNTFFVLGVFLLLVGVDLIGQNALVDSYLILLSVFWLYTRIQLSQLDHKTVCSNCASVQAK